MAGYDVKSGWNCPFGDVRHFPTESEMDEYYSDAEILQQYYYFIPASEISN